MLQTRETALWQDYLKMWNTSMLTVLSVYQEKAWYISELVATKELTLTYRPQ